MTKELQLVKSTADKKMRAAPAKLNMREAHALVNLLLEDFTARHQTYKEYAAYATEKLGFPVAESHVQGRVVQFEIPHGDRPVPPDPSEFTAMLLKHETQIGELTERMLKMEAWVNQTFPSVSGKKMLG
jgi:hypothetical protein